MSILHQIVIMLITLGILVAIHEFGHFWVARRCGVKVLRFSIGFGPVIWRKNDRSGTEFVLSILPLGGYVKMLDEREAPVEPELSHLAFNNKSVSQRIAIVSAGPIANFLLAIIVYCGLFLQGSVGLLPVIMSVEPESIAAKSGLVEGDAIVAVDSVQTQTVSDVSLRLIDRLGDTGHIELSVRKDAIAEPRQVRLAVSAWLGEEAGAVDLYQSLGFGFYEPKIVPLVEAVIEGSAAAKAGILAGDVLISMDGNTVEDWVQWVEYVRNKPNQLIRLTLERNQNTIALEITPMPVQDKGQLIGQVGIKVKPPVIPDAYLVKKEYGLFGSFLASLQRTWETSVFSLVSLKKMLLGQISYKQLSGPISIAKVASDSANSGIYSYLSLLALLSVSLGVLNLLPIPVLDGGHIFFYMLEGLKGSPVPEKIQQMAFQLGMTIVFSIMILALFNDISRL